MKSCPHRLRTHKKCGCPIWVQGTLHGKWMKKSLSLRNWEAAQKLVREWEGGNLSGIENVSVPDACDAFTRDCEARKLSPGSMGKYKLLTNELKEEFKGRVVRSVSVDEVRRYREKWNLSPVTSRKKLERLRTFFRFCQESGWIQTNPAKALKHPVSRPAPTLPFSDAEIKKIVRATEVYPIQGIYGEKNRVRMRAFVNLLRFSGLRIQDAVTLSRDRITGNKLLMYTQKTGTPVYLPLPESVVKELNEASPDGRYFFWSGHGSPKSAVSDWQRSLAKLLELAELEGHAHRFRDTFSVNLLQSGVPLETVSVLLGHTSIRTTERHYAPWVKSRQLKLEESIQKAWKLT